jgi:hypothetical protein
MAMGELTLLPAIRAADADALIVADGFSCRHQIEHGTSRKPLHVAEVLAGALAVIPAQAGSRATSWIPDRANARRE